NIAFGGVIMFTGYVNGNFIIVLAGFVFIVIFFIISYFAFARRRWPLMLATVLHPLWWSVNLIFLANRWSEFAEESAARKPTSVDPLTDPAQELAKSSGINFKLPKEVRVAIFTAVSWMLAVPVFVFIFNPYGGSYLRYPEFMHMLGVMFFPVLTGAFLYFGWTKFVR
ncbi:MAG: hypothetical protein ACQEVT_16655, partial [Pseudomonadota bacterium]